MFEPIVKEIPSYQNPILPCDFSDPDAIRVGEDYYMISSSFTYIPGVPVLHSKDLVHWERVGYCVREIPYERYRKPVHGCGTWAPALRYHEGRFYVFIPMPDEGIFVTTAENPAGEWTPLRCIKEACGWIDPCPLWDEDGNVYMAHAFANSRCGIKHKIQMSKLDPQTLEVIEDGPIVFDGFQTQPTAEGPKMYKRNGWYYIFIPAGGVENGWQTVLRSRSIYGPYEEKIVLHQGNTDINGPHQGAWVDTPEGTDWFVHFQDAGTRGRIIHLQPMCWRGDWPFIGQEQNGDGIGEPVRRWPLPAAQKYDARLLYSDSFAKGEPGLQWQWQGNPSEDWLENVRDEGLAMRICPLSKGASNLLWHMPNVLSQMLPAADFCVSVEADLQNASEGTAMGLTLLGLDYSFAEVRREKHGLQISAGHGQADSTAWDAQAAEYVDETIALSNGAVVLLAEITEGKWVRYSVEENGKARQLAKPFMLKECVWTGARLGLFARAYSEEAQGTALFCNFKVTVEKEG